MKPTEQHWMGRARWLTQALIISGTLNIGLLATFITFVLKERPNPLVFDLKPIELEVSKPQLTNSEILRAYSTLPYQELLIRLEAKDQAEEGFTKRDLALACLVAFHHFNLERALGGLQMQQRQIGFSNAGGQEVIDITIYPGLADYQYEAILHYAKTERWPLTSQGLFYEIKRALSPRDPSLVEAYSLTPEYLALATLFNRTGLSLDKETLVQLVAEGDWKTLQEFVQKQRLAQDLSPERRRTLLLDYLNYRSKIAARLLLESDFEFICKRLDDAYVLMILDILKEKIPQLEAFAKDVLVSPRSDAVLQKAAFTLYSLSGESAPDPLDHRLALRRFLPQSAPPQPLPAEVEKAPIVEAKIAIPKARKNKPKRTHVVQEGDNLWKIARKYRVSVEEIMRHNRLTSERLRPGRILEIPDPKER